MYFVSGILTIFAFIASATIWQVSTELKYSMPDGPALVRGSSPGIVRST